MYLRRCTKRVVRVRLLKNADRDKVQKFSGNMPHHSDALPVKTHGSSALLAMRGVSSKTFPTSGLSKHRSQLPQFSAYPAINSKLEYGKFCLLLCSNDIPRICFSSILHS